MFSPLLVNAPCVRLLTNIFVPVMEQSWAGLAHRGRGPGSPPRSATAGRQTGRAGPRSGTPAECEAPPKRTSTPGHHRTASGTGASGKINSPDVFPIGYSYDLFSIGLLGFVTLPRSDGCNCLTPWY